MRYDDSSFTLNELKIELTHDCRLQCVHCSSNAAAASGRTMEWRFCKELLDNAAAMGVREIAFSGGEPLLWEPVQAAVERASLLRMRTFLYTTGNVPNARKTLRKLSTAGLSRTMFSLFDMSAAGHEEVTRVEDSFKRTLEVASYCVDIGLETEFHFVPLSNNYKALPGIAKLARNMGVKRVSVLRLVPQGRGAIEKHSQLNRSENLELRKTIIGLRAAGHDIRLGSPYNFLMLREKPECHSGIDRMTIGPDLRIFPCDAFKHISPEDIDTSSEYSNLNDHTLSECWNRSPYFSAVRKYLTADFPTECKNCPKLESCNSGCVAQKYYTYGSLLKVPDPMCLMS